MRNYYDMIIELLRNYLERMIFFWTYENLTSLVESYELIIDGKESRIVETAPGWSHDVTNIGDIELVVMLWANEIFDREKPDTVNFKVRKWKNYM